MRYETTCPDCAAATVTYASDWGAKNQGILRPKCSRCGAILLARGKKIRRPKENAATPRRTKKPAVKRAVQVAIDGLEDARKDAEVHGITINANKVSNRVGRRDTIHVMFRTGRWSLVDWWPGTGTVTIGGTTGRQTKAYSMGEALQLAIQAKAIG